MVTMKMTFGSLRSGLPLAICLLFACSSPAHGDGPVLRWKQSLEGMEVSVFTDPPIRTGTVDVSILVVPIPAWARVPAPSFRVCAYPSGSPEKKICDGSLVRAPATNKVFRAGRLDILEPGRWQVVVESDLAEGAELGPFLIEVEEGPGGHSSWMLWVGLPAVAVVVFAAHQRLVHRRSRPVAPSAA